MKLRTLIAPCFALLLGLAAAHATDYTFPPGANVVDYFVTKPGQKFLTIDPDGQLAFKSSAGGLITTFNPDGKDLVSAADDVSVSFKTSGRISFAVFLRAQGEDGESYMAFIGAAPDKTFILYLCKTKFSPTQQPGKTALVLKHFQTYHAGDMYKLRLQLKNEGDKVAFTGELIEEQTGQSVIQLTADDTNSPILDPGKIGFRFFADKADGGGSMDVKSISVTP